jgi:predicted ATPase/signal transduction histidine kinase
MKILSNYTVLEELGESLHSTVFKVSPSENSTTILLLKKIKQQANLPESAKHLQHQIEQLSTLKLPHIPIPKLHHPSQESLFLISPYFDGISLTSWLKSKPQLTLEQALKVIISVAEQLAESHAAGQVHKGINPNNILIKPRSLETQLIDHVRVLDLNQTSHFIYDSTFCSQNLPFLSPEQTNHVSYAVNYTTDLYSLGAVFYLLLTGRAPFLNEDPIEVIHSHLAETAASVHTIKPSTPEPVSRIAALLLEKAPEKRYQTALGLIHDLNHCLAEWTSSQQAHPFTLKQKDFSNQITIPSLMVGRDTQKEKLLNEYKKSCSGHFQSALISGLSGVGKTRLIQELQLPIITHRGYFSSGKFDQFKKHVPYSTLIQAISNLIKVFLTEDNQQISYWRKKIGSTLGDSGKLITDIVPELTLIIGPQPALSKLPPVEARNRFNDVMGRFLASLASKKHPLTLFIDDLQWCDGATFDIFEQVFNNPDEYPFLFLVGAYRHNEVDKSHRLSRLIKAIKKEHRPLVEIRLNPLGIREVNQMTAYILNTYSSRTHALSEVIYQISSGNPLFVNESLRWLHNYQHLHLDEDGTWNWDSEQLKHVKTPRSALDLFKEKIQKLPEQTVELVKTASCLAARFDSDMLALVARLNAHTLQKELSEAFSNNILQQDKDQFSFFHDQVQAAAVSFIDPKQKLAIHARIARAQINAIPKGSDLERLPNLFSIVEHLANSRPLKQSKARRLEESKFNYYAGMAALEALAVDNANYFFHESKKLYPSESWDKNYQFLFSLHKQLARTEIALGNQSKSEQYLDALLNQSRNDIDKADCLHEQTASLSSLGNFKKAIVLGNKALGYLSSQIPKSEQQALKEASFIIDELHCEGGDIWSQLLNAPESRSRTVQIETAIYSELIPDYYLAGMVPQLYLAAMRSAKNCLSGGIDESVIYSFPIISLYLQRQDRYDLSFQYEKLTFDLSERYPNSFGATKGINGVLWINAHNRLSPKEIIALCEKNIHRGKSCGDLYNAGLSYAPYMWNLITQGADLEQVVTTAEESAAFANKCNLHLSTGLAESVLAGWCDLMDSSRSGFSPDEIKHKLNRWEKDKHVVSMGSYYTLRGISNYYLGHHEEAATQLNEAESYLRGLSDNILNRLWFVFRYLNGLQQQEQTREQEALMAHCLERVETWAALGPILKPYLAFMRAETVALNPNFSEARQYYLDAIDRAHDSQYTLLEAHLNERLGKRLTKAHHRYAPFHIRKARALYLQCGAKTKQAQIEAQFAPLLKGEGEPTQQTASLENLLDIDYLTEATRNITQQTDFEPLIKTILQSIMARLGAKTGYLLIAENDTLSIIAKATKQNQVKVEMQRDNAISHENLSPAITRYVLRMGETLVLENAQQKGAFTTDSIVQEQALKSLLCLPLMKQNKLLGLLYFENNLIEAVFTPTQIELAQTLTAQASITLENSLLIRNMTARQDEIQKLNEELEVRVAERTESLNNSNEELKNFAYVVSHDLKAPLRAINQLSGWIAEDYADAFDDDGREQMSLLQNRARRMHEMIDGILEYSRVGRLKEPRETVDIRELLNDVVDGLSPAENIVIEIQPDLPIIKCERLRLFQVFQNLIDNAIKHNDKERMKINISYQPTATGSQFCVADNGPGIDKKYQQKIFQLFQTLSPKDLSKGTGIGLSMIEKMVTNWKGRIWIESVIGQGCQFFFTIPKEESAKYD